MAGNYNPAFGHEKAFRLTNTAHSEVAPCLPLPTLPTFCGAVDQELWLFDEQPSSCSLDRKEVIDQATTIAHLLGNTDVSYLNFKDDEGAIPTCSTHPSSLHSEVLRYNTEAFEYLIPGLIKEPTPSGSGSEQRPFEYNETTINYVQRLYEGTPSHHSSAELFNDAQVSVSSIKPRFKKKGNADASLSIRPDPVELQDGTIQCFCEVLEDLCARAETLNEDQDDADAQPLSSADLKLLVNEIMSIRAKKILHLVPVEVLVRLLNVLDRQIRAAMGLSINNNEDFDSDVVSSVVSAMESTHAALAVMTNHDMPKQLYKEEIIDRILDFSRHRIIETMSACDPSFRAQHKPSENGALEGDEDDEAEAEAEAEADAEFGSGGKKCRTVRSVKTRKSTGNKISTAVNAVLQKLCTILGFLKDLLLIERLSDSLVLQLVKTTFETFLVDNIQILQLKAISLICAIFSSYTQHRIFLMDETVRLLWKLPSSKHAMRSYYLPDEGQIQMITALLIQLTQCSSNIPEKLRQAVIGNSIMEVSVDAIYPTKCYEAATDTCCVFWTRVLERVTAVKAQDVSELKVVIENIVMDLLMTLNLPEYPAAAHILQVLCVLLLQNAGLKSKDMTIRTLAIDLVGTIGARLKRDSVYSNRDKFWISDELANEDHVDPRCPKDTCSSCLDRKSAKILFVCQGCERAFHKDCIVISDHDIPTCGWYCPFCLCKKQLIVLQSYCKLQCKDNVKKNQTISEGCSVDSESITKVEIVQQMLLDYLQEAASDDDAHLFARWFYLCIWYKDDPSFQQKFIYYIARLKSKAIVQDFGSVSSILNRESARKISLALGTNNTFSRGFDKILCLLLANLREGSPTLRAKALRAVSLIVEADPEVLCDKRVQCAVEGRFSDTAISVREAALELVGRHIASHPDVGLKYFEKVAERVKDTGVSVRKRAIKIIRDMCTSNANFPEFTSACIVIISRVTDDESSIQDLVCKTFYEFWFEEPTESQTQCLGDGSSVPLEVSRKTEQVVQMLRKMHNHQLLVSVIRRSLALDFFPQSSKATGINPVLLASVRKRCELMCKCLLERMLQVEETDNEEVEVRALPYVLVMHAFCVVDPTLCVPASDPSQFVVTLQPYLKSQVDNREGARLLECIIFVIDVVLPLLHKLPQCIVEEIEQDFKHMIIRHSYLTVVHACIKCLCSLSKVAGKGGNLVEHLILIFLKHLDSLNADNKEVVGRSLFCLGLLFRYGNELMITSDKRNIHVDKSLTLLKKYLGSEDYVIKVRSLQALGSVLIARPDYMLERDVGKFLEATLSSSCDPRLKMQSLQNIYEYLHDAESKMGTDKTNTSAIHYPEGGSSVPVAAGAGDTNICGGIVQLYWDGILGRCLDMNEQVRQTALKIVEVVLRQGLVHPITCVPYLIALETDPQEANSKLAHHLLVNMNDKYPSFFENRLGDGLQLSFNFIQSFSSIYLEHSGQNKVSGNIKGKSDATSSHARLGVSRIYRLIRGNRTSRNKFMSSVIRKFDSPSTSQSWIPFLMYCAEILASLPFMSPDEPLYLIYSINRVVQVRAGALEATMKTLSLYSLEGNAHMNPNENAAVQTESMLEPSSNGIAGVDGNSIFSADCHGYSKDDLQSIQTYCKAAAALRILLKLKRHLKIVFSLDDARCQSFSPNEPLKPGDVLSKQSIPFNIGEVCINLPTSYKEVSERYQEFKIALREDTVDYSSYSANIKRKRPPPRSSRGGRTSRETHGYYNEEDDEDCTDRNPNFSNSVRKSNVRARQRT